MNIVDFINLTETQYWKDLKNYFGLYIDDVCDRINSSFSQYHKIIKRINRQNNINKYRNKRKCKFIRRI